MTDEQITAWWGQAHEHAVSSLRGYLGAGSVLRQEQDNITRLKFAELVAAHEREECARAVEAMDPGDVGSPWMVPRPVECAAAIRRRTQEEALQQLADDAQELGMGY